MNAIAIFLPDGSSYDAATTLQMTHRTHRCDVTVSVTSPDLLSSECRCSAYIFPALKPFRLTFLRMRDICKIINVQRKDQAFMV